MTEHVLELPHGVVHAWSRGPHDGLPVLCAHGLSANHHAFDVLGAALAADGRRVVALDLRGRGASPDTGPGTYGLRAHAEDVLAAADALGAGRFALLGWSMGALAGIHAAALAGDRLEALVLLDHAGWLDPAAEAAVRAGLARLDAVVPTADAYVDRIRGLGAIDPWHPQWEAQVRHELAPGADGQWRPRTSRRACTEDLDAMHAPEAEWPALTMPTLLVRATRPLGGGLVVPEDARDALVAAAPGVRVLETEHDHYGVVTGGDVVAAVRGLLAA